MPLFGDRDIRYGFAVGRVRVLETRLLGPGTYERLLDAPSFGEQKRILSETHFGRYLDDADTASEVERRLDASLADLYEEFLESSGLPEAVVRFFRLPYDYANLKAGLKARLIPGADVTVVSGLGDLPAEAFAHPEDLPVALAETAGELLHAEEAPGSEQIDVAVDRAMFAELAGVAHASGLDFLERLAERMSAIANVKVLMRACAAGRSTEEVAGMLVEGAHFDASRLAAHVRKQPAELAAEIVAAGALHGVAPGELTDLESLDVVLDAALGGMLHRARIAASGPEPVLGYVLARQSEATSLRAVLVGKILGIDRDTVFARLRAVAA